jgi:hypothetical protein
LHTFADRQALRNQQRQIALAIEVSDARLHELAVGVTDE